MTKRQILEDKILTDLFSEAAQGKNAGQTFDRVDYFNNLISQAEREGRVVFPDETVIVCAPTMVKFFAQRYTGVIF